MPIYDTTCRALQEGFQYEMLKLENSKDKGMVREIEKNGGSKKEVADVRGYILSKSKDIQEGRPIQVLRGSGVEKIKGDGHCLFRATAHGLADLHKADSEFLPGLEQRLKTEYNKKVAKKLKKVIALIPKGKGEQNSNKLVWALRDLACSYNEVYHRNRAGQNPSVYFNSMRNTNAWGGGPEIDAFIESLGVQICTSKDEAAICGYDPAKPTITLQFAGGHYNLYSRVDAAARQSIASAV